MKRSLWIVVALAGSFVASAAIAAPPNSMTVATFLEKEQRLEARRPLAAFSPDTHLLQQEAQASFVDWLAQAHAPNACPPKGSRWRGDPQKFLEMLHAVPVTERPRLSVREAFRRDWNARYPCR